ncbi:hypothetical protein EYF80_060871 [Liparis tanakae]|uniref:Uncharacterized protein n=1 Tax=Liparis tanakae TaxID=230148 RepID=A0A4Z2EJK7_9TELE|nr:hypothetical protein EYF80_060871 [Liparis tanakae]
MASSTFQGIQRYRPLGQ